MYEGGNLFVPGLPRYVLYKVEPSAYSDVNIQDGGSHQVLRLLCVKKTYKETCIENRMNASDNFQVFTIARAVGE